MWYDDVVGATGGGVGVDEEEPAGGDGGCGGGAIARCEKPKRLIP